MGWQVTAELVTVWVVLLGHSDVSLKGKKEPKLTHIKNTRKEANTYGQSGMAVLRGTGAPC